jgi:hypothetical protein
MGCCENVFGTIRMGVANVYSEVLKEVHRSEAERSCRLMSLGKGEA